MDKDTSQVGHRGESEMRQDGHKHKSRWIERQVKDEMGETETSQR